MKKERGQYESIAFNAKKSDGFNPQLVVCDEMAAWSGDAGLKQYEVMKSALGARTQPMILSISTAGYINDSIYDELMKRSTSFLKGNSKERRLLPFLYMIDDVEKWNDIDELKKANPNMGVSVKESFFMDEIAVAEGSLSKKAEFLTKYCNIKQNSSIAWLEYQTVENAGVEKTLEDFRGVTGSVVNAVSSVGVVDAVGRVWEWLDELITRAEHATNADYHASVAWGWDKKSPLNTGEKSYDVGNIYQYYAYSLAALIAGGNWINGAYCGARAVDCSIYPWIVYTSIGARGACDSL